MISRCDYLGSFFGLLRWDRGSNTLLLSSEKPSFRTTSILTYKGPRGVWTPPVRALPPISGNSSFFLSFLYIKRTQKTHDCLLNSNLARLREGLGTTSVAELQPLLPQPIEPCWGMNQGLWVASVSALPLHYRMCYSAVCEVPAWAQIIKAYYLYNSNLNPLYSFSVRHIVWWCGVVRL